MTYEFQFEALEKYTDALAANSDKFDNWRGPSVITPRMVMENMPAGTRPQWLMWWRTHRDLYVGTAGLLPRRSTQPGSDEAASEQARKASVAALKIALADRSPDVRRAAALALAAIGRVGDGLATPLGRLCGDKDRKVRRIAALSLSMQPDPKAREYAVRLLRMPGVDAHVRAHVLLGQGYQTGKPAGLLEQLRAAKDRGVRQALLLALKRRGDASATDALLALAEGRKQRTTDRVLAAGALAGTALGAAQLDRLAALARSRDPLLSRAAVRAIGEVKGDVAPRLRELVRDGKLLRASRGPLYIAVARQQLRDLRPWLIACLTDGPVEARDEAALALGLLGDRAAVPALLASAKKVRNQRLAQAARMLALALLKAPGARGLVKAALRADGHEHDALAVAATAAGLLGLKEDAKQLAEMMDAHLHPSLRRAAAGALCALGRMDLARERVIADLGHKQDSRRSMGARTLGEIPDPALTTRMIALLSSRSEDLRLQAAGALGRLHDRGRWSASGQACLPALMHHLELLIMPREAYLRDLLRSL